MAGTTEPQWAGVQYACLTADILIRLCGKISVSVNDIINDGSVPFMCPVQCDS